MRRSLHLAAATLLAGVVSAPLALAVPPLVTDDADTMEPHHVQLNGGWQFDQATSARSHAVSMNPVLGLTSRGELGATLAYDWLDRFGRAAKDADGISDLTLETKWWLWQRSDGGFKLSARVDVKLPTGSRQSGLGTGHTDVAALLIGTRCWGRPCVDWNVGYVAIDAPRGVLGDDEWFLGQAVRHELTRQLTLMGETYAVLPGGADGNPATAHFRAGVQLPIRESVLLSGLIGSGVGHDSPHLTVFLGFTWTGEIP